MQCGLFLLLWFNAQVVKNAIYKGITGWWANIATLDAIICCKDMDLIRNEHHPHHIKNIQREPPRDPR